MAHQRETDYNQSPEKEGTMTYYQATLAQLSDRFSPANVSKVNLEVLAAGKSLLDVGDSLGLVLTDAERTFIGSYPPGLQEAVRGALYGAVRRGIPVTFGGEPSNFFGVRIWETSGGMSIIIVGPVPL